MGDLGYNAPHFVTGTERIFISKFLSDLSQWTNSIYVMRGNHDMPLFIESLSYVKNHVYGLTKITSINYDRVNLVFCPWIPSTSFKNEDISEQEYMDNILKWEAVEGKLNILFSHNVIRGATVGGFELVSDRDMYIEREVADVYDHVFAGHIHHQQTLFEGKAVHIGSPYQITYGEKKTTGSAILFDTETREATRVDIAAFSLKTIEVDATNIEAPSITTVKGMDAKALKEFFDNACVRIKVKLKEHKDMAYVNLSYMINMILSLGGNVDKKDILYSVEGSISSPDSIIHSPAQSPYEVIRSKLNSDSYEVFDTIYAGLY